MAGPGLLSDRGDLEALFDELAVELRRLGIVTEVVMVGGAWLLWHAQRVASVHARGDRGLMTLGAELRETEHCS